MKRKRIGEFYIIPREEADHLLKRMQKLSIDVEIALLEKKCVMSDGETLMRFNEKFLAKNMNLSETDKGNAGKQTLKG